MGFFLVISFESRRLLSPMLQWAAETEEFMSSRRYFNEELETLSKAKLQALQLRRLQAMVERAYTQNTFYRKLYDEAGVKPGDIRALEDIQKLPFLEKKT